MQQLFINNSDGWSEKPLLLVFSMYKMIKNGFSSLWNEGENHPLHLKRDHIQLPILCVFNYEFLIIALWNNNSSIIKNEN